jgi:hypothetical protein
LLIDSINGFILCTIEKNPKINAYQKETLLNPFISITPSKPLMSSGSWLTLHNFEIYYLLAVNYDPASTDLILIRVNIYPGPGEGGSQLIFKPIILSGSLFSLQPYLTTLEEVTIYPKGRGEGAYYRLIFLTIYFIRVPIYLVTLSHNISRGHYLPCNTYCLVLACIKATIHFRPLNFCHDLANI